MDTFSSTHEIKTNMADHQKSPSGPREVITQIHPHDVVSGRGNENKANVHPGNVHFRNLVRRHKLEYVSSLKRDKPEFAKAIVHEIINKNPPGRFLKQDKATGNWYDIGYKQALTKTRQALREGASLIKRNRKEKIAAEETQQRQQQLQQHQYQYPPQFQDQRQFQHRHQYQHHQYQHHHQHQDNLHPLLHSTNGIGSIGENNLPRSYLLPTQHVQQQPQPQQLSQHRFVVPSHVTTGNNQRHGMILQPPQRHAQAQDAQLSLQQVQEAQRTLQIDEVSQALQLRENLQIPQVKEDPVALQSTVADFSRETGGGESVAVESNQEDSDLSPCNDLRHHEVDNTVSPKEEDDYQTEYQDAPEDEESVDPVDPNEGNVPPIIKHYLQHMRQRKDRKEHQQKDTLDAMNALLHLKATRG